MENPDLVKMMVSAGFKMTNANIPVLERMLDVPPGSIAREPGLVLIEEGSRGARYFFMLDTTALPPGIHADSMWFNHKTGLFITKPRWS